MKKKNTPNKFQKNSKGFEIDYDLKVVLFSDESSCQIFCHLILGGTAGHLLRTQGGMPILV